MRWDLASRFKSYAMEGASGVIRLFQDFQDDPFSQFHASGSEQRSDT